MPLHGLPLCVFLCLACCVECVAGRTVNLHVACGSCSASSLSEKVDGGGVELPEVVLTAGCLSAGWAFAGWAADVCEPSSVAPDLHAAGAVYVPIAGKEDLYAVFSQTTGGGYRLMTEPVDDWSGRYLLSSGDSLFMDGALQGGKDGIGAQDAFVRPGKAIDGTVVSDDWGDLHSLTVTAVSANLSKGYLFATQAASTPYFYTTAAASDGSMSATANKSTAASHPFFIYMNDKGEAAVMVHTFSLRYNAGQRMFRFYESAANEPLSLYRKTPQQTIWSSSPDCCGVVPEERGTVVFMVNGVQDSVVVADRQGHVSPYKPSVSCKGSRFCGWTAQVLDVQQSPPAYVDFATAVFSKGQTVVHAVFATANGGELTDVVEETEYEDFNSCTPAATYKEDVQILETACGLKWEYVFGCPSATGSPVFFNNTTGFRLQQQKVNENYVTAGGRHGIMQQAGEVYLELLTPVEDLVKVTFMAGRNSGAVSAAISYLDGGMWSGEQQLSMLTTRSTMNTLQLPSPLTTRIRIRITSLGAKANYLYLDDFVFYARQREWLLSDYSAVCRTATSDVSVQSGHSGGRNGSPQKIISNGRLLIMDCGKVRDILGRPVHGFSYP